VINYSPVTGDPIGHPIKPQPKHCFLITQLGKNKPDLVNEIQKSINKCCQSIDYKTIDASTLTTGKDFLIKIWELIISVPICVIIIHKDTPVKTQANLYYELGIAQALGKETIVIKTPEATMPSDLIRTEYIEFNDLFNEKFNDFLKCTIRRSEYFAEMAENTENNPLLAIDYLKRAFLITGDNKYKNKVNDILKLEKFEGRAKSSIELLATKF